MKAQYSGEAIEFMKKRGVGIVLKRFLRPVKSPGFRYSEYRYRHTTVCGYKSISIGTGRKEICHEDGTAADGTGA